MGESPPSVQIAYLPPVSPICYVYGCVDIGHALSAIQVKNKRAADRVFSERRAFIWRVTQVVKGTVC